MFLFACYCYLKWCIFKKILFIFLDEDEVGDRITVRSDEELKAMLSYVSISMKNYFVMPQWRNT